MRGKQYFLLGCGYFPPSLIQKVSVAAAECAILVANKRPRIITDLPLYEIPIQNWIFPPERQISRGYWQNYATNEEYYASLLFPGDELHAFAFARDPGHCQALMELDDYCAYEKMTLRLHLF